MLDSFTVLLTPAEEGGFIVEVPRLPGCVTEGDSYEDAVANAREAILLYLDAMAARGLSAPRDEAPVITRVSVAVPEVHGSAR